MGWLSSKVVQADRTVHVWPLHDNKPHETEPFTERCWCWPIAEQRPTGNWVIKHRDQLDRLGLDW